MGLFGKPSPPPPPPPSKQLPPLIDGAAAALDSFTAAVRGARTPLTDGAVAQAAVIAALLPLDALKTRLQIMHTTRPSVVRSSLAVAGDWYAGLLPAVVGALPYGALTFGSYEVAKEVLAERAPGLPRRRRLVLAACIGDAVGSLWLAPAEVVKQKLQTGMYPNAATAVRVMARTDGPGAFYQGYWALLARDLPARAVQLAVYEALKARLLAAGIGAAAAPGAGAGDKSAGVRRGRPTAGGGATAAAAASSSASASSSSTPLSTPVAVALGAASGAITGAATTPLDLLKTRMMAQRGGAGNLYANLVHAAVQSVRVDGPATLFRGVLPRAAYTGASAAFFFGAYEAVKRVHAAAAVAGRGAGAGGRGPTAGVAGAVPRRVVSTAVGGHDAPSQPVPRGGGGLLAARRRSTARVARFYARPA
ncbi:hypothetical protein I4F81_005326 [Pyropia yezoensis]|uniref:Uncharacterized protein n=1 Tax=Pyropia yezoensis TaxID=2788 RepID=A0ACC3BXN6_PYRYE|nr:hypothetical protein I4F81_005326 [Neopyropia yezoensis]